MTERPAAGFLRVDKPAGPTSHDVVRTARRGLGLRRVGHTGTLDPFATGLLLLAVGWATRLAEYLHTLPKTYLATVRLGAATDTDDRTGSVIASSADWHHIDSAAIQQALQRMIGEIDQVPPIYSAKKVGGQRLYKAARDGQTIAVPPSTVTVHSIHMLRLDLPDIDLEITCSTGTYIRAIARDMGSDLGVYGHVTELRRTGIGPHGLEGAVTLDELADGAAVPGAWIDPAAAVSHLPAVQAGEEEINEIVHGRAIPALPGAREGATAILGDGCLIAIGDVADGALHPRKVFGA